MTTDTKTNAYIEETGESAYAVNITVSGHALKVDQPVAGGGENLGPSPYGMLLAALGECMAMTVRWYSIQQEWPLQKVEVTLTHEKVDEMDVFEKTIIIHGVQLTDNQRQKLMDVSAKCLVQRTLESDIVIRTL